MRRLEEEAAARLATIRCIKTCTKNIREGKPFPRSICYVPEYYKYKIGLLEHSNIKVYESPEGKEIDSLSFTSHSILYVDGDEIYCRSGIYGKLIKYKLSPIQPELECTGFVQIVSVDRDSKATESNLHMINEDEPNAALKNTFNLFFKPKYFKWQKAVENEFSCGSPNLNDMIDEHKNAVNLLNEYPADWSYDHDLELLKFLSDPEVLNYCGHAETTRKSIKNIEVSSFGDNYSDKDHLIDDNPETYWESDDSSTHWIRLTMEDNIIIKSLSVLVAEGDDNYFPKRIAVKVGASSDKLQEVRETKLNYTSTVGVREVTVLGEQVEFHQFIQIEIKECMDDGIDTRIRGIKVRIEKKRSQELAVYTFKNIMDVKFPRLTGLDLILLRRRVLLLTRLVALFENVAKFLTPNWNNNPTEPCKLIQSMKPFYSLSVKRLDIVEELLHLSEYDNSSGDCPSLHINRLSKTEHRANPKADPECRKTVFVQVYDGLLKADLENFDYRWGSNSRSQWWECKFTQEGIIDQGGGFRDSLSDIAEELCPPGDCPDLLPLFVRAPNQRNASMNIYKDAFVPSPSCSWFKRYEWLGKLMGACFRSKENLVLNLSPFVWKKLCGEPVNWNDFSTVDESDVKVLNSIESMSENEFQSFFGGEIYWTAILSDGSEVELSMDGSHNLVTYEDRFHYCKQVKKIRMAESDKQIDAIRRGLLSVVPQSALDLLNWEEVERRVCGAAEITMESLKSSTHFEELMENDSRTKYMWIALENFNDDERSRFLRFVTGRKRLPAPVYICSLKNGNEDDIDSLPESSTCSNTLYLPKYSSSTKCEEKLRYAIYNCLAIDADMMPYDME